MAKDHLKPDLFDKTSAFEFITGRQPKRQTLWRKKDKPVKAKTNRSFEYEEYLASPEWKLFRHNIIMARGKQCQSCLATGCRIDLHHKHYKNFKNERPEDVILLCADCHVSLHLSWRKRKHGRRRRG